MMPQTKWWHELLSRDVGDKTTVDDLEDQAIEGITPEDPRYLQLQMKRKHMTNMLKRMLIEGGYPDLAKMTTIRRVGYEGGGPEY